MKNLLISYLTILLLMCFVAQPAFAGIDLSGGDKVQHYFWGMAQMGLYESFGWDKHSSYQMVFLTGCLKETLDLQQGENFDWNDMLANMLGAYTFELANGVYFKFIYKP